MKSIIEAARAANLQVLLHCHVPTLRQRCDGAGLPPQVLDCYPHVIGLGVNFDNPDFRAMAGCQVTDEGITMSISFAGLGLSWVSIPWPAVVALVIGNPAAGVWPEPVTQPETPPPPPRGFRVIDGGKA